mmetsp:Transcript_4166/g.12201  ORF Transcript_4166/g.12201 Transcript_4166/m.12201 type:complete len:771 (+) Transcript_4166:93-2405(+)|eukprot:CAMPEP_0168378408 /NCGR_PEP_ID=MMETSP0228-20121227/11322_1 /TAXON_ID=133427 /ORGANISM="Protoceratium reticulatum, Strain CCCM 535 (=CCMP 1889)" /LENGTH=770 /DNA_ID=CAMNT_0008391427 /DNA_START=71 /DNA_END=2383 /DNA_ORIENTATION=+
MAAITTGNAAQYSQDALDETRSELAREAAMLYSVAEGRLSEEEFDEAERAGREALVFFRELGNKPAVADTLRILISVYIGKEDVTTAQDMILDELERFREIDDLYGEGAMLLTLTELTSDRVGLDAVHTGTEALGIFVELGDQQMEATTHLAMSNVHRFRSAAKQSLEAATASLELYRSTSDKLGEAKALHSVGAAYGLLDRWSDALKHSKMARAIFQELGATRPDAGEAVSCAAFHEQLRDYASMLQDAEEAMELYSKCDSQRGQAEAAEVIVKAHKLNGDQDTALTVADQALTRSQEAGHKRGQAKALESLVNLNVEKNLSDEALPLAEQALELHRELGDKAGQATMLYIIADIHQAEQRFGESEQAAQEAIYLMKEMGDVRGEGAVVLNILVNVYRSQGKFAEAINRAVEAQELFRKADDQLGEGDALLVYGILFLEIQQADTAVEWVRQAAEIFQDVSDPRRLMEAYLIQYNIHRQKEEPEPAIGCCKQALAQAQNCKDKTLEVNVQLCLVQAYFLQLNRYTTTEGSNRSSREFTEPLNQAEKAATQALKLTEKTESPRRADALFVMAQVHLIGGKMREAEQVAGQAEALFDTSTDKAGAGYCAALRAQVYVYSGRFQEGLTAAEKALEIATEIQDKQLEEQATARLEQIRGTPAQPMFMQQQMVMQSAAEAMPEVSSAIVEEKPKGLDRQQVEDMLMSMLTEMVGVQMEADVPFMDAGVDSLMSIEFRSQVNGAFAGLQLSSTLTFDYPTVRDLTGHIVDKSLAQ